MLYRRFGWSKTSIHTADKAAASIGWRHTTRAQTILPVCWRRFKSTTSAFISLTNEVVMVCRMITNNSGKDVFDVLLEVMFSVKSCITKQNTCQLFSRTSQRSLSFDFNPVKNKLYFIFISYNLCVLFRNYMLTITVFPAGIAILLTSTHRL